MHGRCRGAKPTEFFPSDGMGVEIAQRVCDGCAVRIECLEYALLTASSTASGVARPSVSAGASCVVAAS